ncbi:MAG: HEAT repeat domain-containing protein, partial [Planctomycetota bacterium]
NGNAPKDKLVKVIETALEQWSGSDDEIQFAYIRLLGAGAEAADAELKGKIVSDLLHLLRSGRTEWLQSGAAEALENFPMMQIVTDDLIEALQKSKSDEVRFYVVKALGALGDSLATEPLIDAARTGSATVIDACALSMHDLAKKGAFDPRKLFEEYARPGAGEGERANLLRCLANIEGSEADGLLLDALSSEQDTQLRRDALKYLDARLRAGFPPHPGLEDALIRILESRDRPLYTGAVTLLVNLKSTKSLQHIEKVLQDNISDKLIRIVALRALAILGGDESARTLLRYASKMNARTIQDKENLELSNDVFAALQMCDRELLRRVLDEIIEKPPDPDMRFAALVATSIFERGEFLPVLMEILNDEKASPRARSGAIVALGNRKEEKALPVLKKLMASGEPDIAYSTAVALGTMKDLSGALPLIQRLREEILKSERDRLLVDLVVKALNKISGGADLGENPTAWQEWYNKQAGE